MPAKAKIKVVTEEIKEDKPEVEKVQEVQKVETPEAEEPEPNKTVAAAAETSKLTSFSTLDVKSDALDPHTPVADVSVESPADTPSEAPVEKSETTEDLPKDMSSDDIKAWLTDVRPDTSKEMEKGGKSGFKLFLIFFLLLVAVGLAAGGVYYYKNNTSASKEEAQSEEAKTTPAETATPEPTKVTVDVKKFSINVLNGSGVTGEAKKVSDILVKEGFAEAKTGNAANSNFTKTEVAVKEAVPADVFDLVKDSLDTYDVVKAEKVLDAKSAYDIVITVGAKK